MSRPRLLAVDLDGTLLDLRGQPHEHDVQALRAVLDAGVHVSIITGRLYSGTKRVAERLGLRGAVGCADGSHLVDAGLHATLLHLGVRGADSKHLREVLAAESLTTFVFAEDSIGHDGKGDAYVEYVRTWSTDLRPASDVYAHPLWDSVDGITAVVTLGPMDHVERAARRIGESLSGAAVVAKFPLRRAAHAGIWAMMVRSTGGTKGTALQWIAQHHGIALTDTVCVGDWINDVAMFELAGRSFAMGQAPPEVKAKASDVLPETVDEGGGVARAVEEAFGIRAEPA